MVASEVGRAAWWSLCGGEGDLWVIRLEKLRMDVRCLELMKASEV